MTTQHTPGPWTRHKWHSQEDQISAKGGTIALVSHIHTLVPEAEADANARLIAAAPDLLAALEAIVKITDGSQPNYPAVLMVAQAAIAKATGSK